MVRTTVGYAGGTTADPVYERLADHTEVVRVEYDPTVITYRQLLDVFWDSHDACRLSYSRQYRSVILFSGDRQRREAEVSIAVQKAEAGCRPATALEPLTVFHPAEDYHQKYYLKRRPEIAGSLRSAYPDPKTFAASTAAARLNGFAGRNGTAEDLARDADSLGLTAEEMRRLELLVR